MEKIQNGLTKRLPECCAAEKDAGREGFIQVNIEAGQKSCESVPIIKIEKQPDPWISQTSGYETIYHPEQVCGNYVNFPNGSSWCRINHQKLYRNTEGLTRRLPDCIHAEEEQKK